MEYRALVFFVLLHCSINALPYNTDSHESEDITINFEDDDKHILDHILDDKEQEDITLDLKKTTKDADKEISLDEQQKPKEIELEKKIVTDKIRPAKYEVTETIVDVPDDRTKGPIVTNFSIQKPLNIASNPAPNVTEVNDKDKNSNDRNKNTVDNGNKLVDEDEKDGSGKKNYISILHVKAEIDDKNDKTDKDRLESSDFGFGNVPHVSGIKEYFNGIKRGIVNGFNSIIHKHRNDEEIHTHDAETGPFSFFNKIHRKSSDFAQKIHNHIFGDEDH